VNTLTLFSEGGQLLSEGPAASTSSAVIYLDSMPVARVKAGVINPIEADHLGSPRNMQATAGTSSVWTWNLMANTATGSNAFGEQASAGTVTDFNLRFPGQYADGNGLSYNYFRDYEAASGRYVESDPIGLRGGISSFGYVEGNPTQLSDPQGLASFLGCILGPYPQDCFRQRPDPENKPGYGSGSPFKPHSPAGFDPLLTCQNYFCFSVGLFEICSPVGALTPQGGFTTPSVGAGFKRCCRLSCDDNKPTSLEGGVGIHKYLSVSATRYDLCAAVGAGVPMPGPPIQASYGVGN
jgi:RHS repeat-associated protein